MNESILTENTTLLDNVNLEAEDLKTDVEDDVEDVVSEENEETEEESTDDASEESDDSPTVFNKKQQDEINKLVRTRLERQEAKIVKDLAKAAGVDIAYDEITSAARLWGLLKLNPELSTDIDKAINIALSSGKAKMPVDVSTTTDAITQRLELKEAILDLRASDRTFGKNANKIIAWAENEGFNVNNAQALKMAFLAWKGAQGKVEEAVQKAQEKRKQDNKKALQKQANVQSTKTTKPLGGTVDYSKMSDVSVLAAEGLSLFTDD